MAWLNSDEYSHGFLIVPLSCYIIWRKKESLAAMPLKPSIWGLLLIIFSLLFYMAASFAQILTIMSLSMLLLLAGVVIYFYGFTALKELSFPLFLLLLMIPIPGQIYSSFTISLQLFVTNATVLVAGIFGIPIYQEGNVIHIPDHTMQVVQACSGLRSMMSLVTLSAIMGYLSLQSNILRSILFIAGIPVAVLVNIIRVLLTIFAFYYLNYDLAKDPVHTIFGMFIFFIALGLILIIREVFALWDK